MDKTKKRKAAVISIGVTLTAVTFIATVVRTIYGIKNEASDPIDKRLIVLAYLFLIFPIVLEELSLFRSVYKLLFFHPRKSAKVCYIISSVLVVAALIFQALVLTEVITKDIYPDGPVAASSRFIVLLLLTEWSAIIASFVLGSIRKQKSTADQGQNDDNPAFLPRG
ncbi:MAG: hypothetical protein J5793_02825 [Clostridia bacterium]|nr:hypothetical protein [Clostridia bacterium]